LGIVRSGEVWASMIHYMNDSSEFRLALHLVKDLIAELDDIPEQTRQLVAEFIHRVRFVAIFAFSLSEQKDLLSQWRAYAGSGGYALGFSKDVLEAIVDEDKAILAPCVYNEHEQRALLRPIVEQMLRTVSDSSDNARGIDLFRVFTKDFLRVAAVIKDSSFEAEQEWRLLFGPGIDPSTTDAKTSGSMIVPYHKCSIKRGGRYPIQEIVVGPSQDVELAGRSLRYVTADKFHWPVKIVQSQSTFRRLS